MLTEQGKAEGNPMTRVGHEAIECFACGEAFARTTLLDIDPHDMAVLGDETVVREASAIRCPYCGYEETRPLRARESVRFPARSSAPPRSNPVTRG